MMQLLMENGSPLRKKMKKDSDLCSCDVCMNGVKKEISKVRREFFKGIMSMLNKEIERLEFPFRGVGIMTRNEVTELINALRKKMIEIGQKI